MKTRLSRFFSLLVPLALICCVAPAAAYWPPCQLVTGPTVSGHQVVFSVHNPATNTDIPGSWTTPTSSWTVDQLVCSQGIVAWRARGTTSFASIIGCATYDPVRGWMVYAPRETDIGPDYNLVSVKDGVVWYESIFSGPTTKYNGQYFRTYDPGRGTWKSGGFETQGNLSGTVTWRESLNGVVAFRTNITTTGGEEICFSVYDPSRGVWANGSAGGGAGDSIYDSNIGTSSTTVYFGLNVYDNYYWWGYRVNTGLWSSVIGVMDNYAAFVAQPVSGNAPLTVWVTDMSLGCPNGGNNVTFSYDWGDGSAASSNRSGYHTYNNPHLYILSHTTTRESNYPPATNTQSVQIQINRGFSAPTGSIYLLLLGGD